MPKVNNKKQAQQDMDRDNFNLPKNGEKIVRVRTVGTTMHAVLMANKKAILMSLPAKFRKVIKLKTGDFVLVQPAKEGINVAVEFVRLLTKKHIKVFKEERVWPVGFMDSRDKKYFEMLPQYDTESEIDTDSEFDSDFTYDSDSGNDREYDYASDSDWENEDQR